MSNETWSIDPENKKQIDGNLAGFIIEHADKSLRHTIEVADKATNRAFTLLLILLPITSTFIGLLVNEIKEKHKYRTLDLYFFGILIIICLTALGMLVKLIFPRDSMVAGREPKDILTNEMLQNELSAEKKLLAFKFNEIKNYQFRITYNRQQNAQRISSISHILRWTGIAAFTAIITYLIILYQLAAQ